MSLQLGDSAPDFTAQTTEGEINFHRWAGDSWVILFSHPKDFTPVCTTELGYVARLKPEFDRRNVKAIGLSVDALDSHQKWSRDIAETQGHGLNFPLIADSDREVARLYGMIHPRHDELYTVRTVFVIDPQKKLAAEVQADLDLGKRIGIEHTPTIWVVTARSKGAPFVEVVDRTKLYEMIDQAIADTRGH